jgi:predicted ATPase/class 3 adenylate cyclase
MNTLTGGAGRELPAGTVTFLFTDIEGSTRLLQQLGVRYEAALEDHRRVVREAVAAHAGCEVSTEGDAFFIAFASATQAAAAAASAQKALAAFPWPEGGSLKVRMGLHTGEATPIAGDYVGLDVHRAARICAAGHGGQILISQATRNLVESAPPDGTTLRDLGEHRLKDLLRAEHLFQLVVPGLPADFPPLRTLDIRPNNLPIQLTTFIGREREVTEAARLLASSRLLTLTGPGGTGKTRLALQLGADLVEQYGDGVYFVPLAPISDPELVASTIGMTLGLQEARGRPPLERLQEHLKDRQVLLILDNFEQVLAAAPVVTTLLKAGERLKIVVTSRAALRVYGEQEYPVPPLQLPDPRHLPALESLSQYEAVALFIQRALAVKPDFRITNENAPAVAEITARLDGLPLGIELAAARIKLLSPQAMLARLQRRLTTLGGVARDLPVRQQTLRDAIAWSYDLLDGPSQRLFARLAVFVGGCGLEEAEAVCGPAEDLGRDVLDGIAGLVDHSLLRQEETGGESRFVMLETIREFALERLAASGEAGEIRRRHALAYVAFAERAAPHVTGPEQARWLDRLETEHDNLRAAVQWSIDLPERDLALQLGWTLWRFWQMRGHLREARERLTTIVALPDARDRPEAYARALEAAGGVAYWQGDLRAAETWYAEALAIQRARQDRAAIAEAAYNLSFVYWFERNFDPARALLEESLGLFEALGDRAGIAKTHWAFTSQEYGAGNYAAARRHLDVCLPIFRALNDRFGLGWALHDLGLIDIKEGHYDQAHTALAEGLKLFADARDVSGLALLLDDLCQLAVAEGQLERAARLAGGAAALQASSGTDLATLFNIFEGRSRPGEQAGGQAALTAAWEEGRAMPVDQLVAYGLQRGRDATPAP